MSDCWCDRSGLYDLHTPVRQYVGTSVRIPSVCPSVRRSDQPHARTPARLHDHHMIFPQSPKSSFEQISFGHDAATGYRGIIAIHSTALGPAIGGTRYKTYENDATALTDVRRLARGMSYKTALADVPLGGGKSVVYRVEEPQREGVFSSHGEHVERLAGRYITAEDVGTRVDDMVTISSRTRHVVGLPGMTGDPAPNTAYGVFCGMRALAKKVFGTESLSGRKVTIQGLGNVGWELAKLVHTDGAAVIATDIDNARCVKASIEFGAEIVNPDSIYDVESDIFAPCALGATLNSETIPRLRCTIVAGAANNQLLDDAHGDLLHARQIVYGPDYVLNAGGMITGNAEMNGRTKDEARQDAERIYDRTLEVFNVSEERGISLARAADVLAEDVLAGRKGELAKGGKG